MKKFFKALAVVLALTLVIGTIPASAAEAELSLKKTGKIIYIGGSQGKKADGTACTAKSAAYLSKLVKNFDKNTMTVKVATEDAAIAKASKKTSKVKAVAIGTTKATITVYDSDDIKIFEQSIDLEVKKNAATVAVKADELLTGKVGVNTPYTVVLPRKADGKFVDTDARNLIANDDSVVIKKVAPTTFEVTFTKAGEFEITPVAYQSKKFPGATAQGEVIKVSAALNAVSTKQASLKSAYVEFDCSVVTNDKLVVSAENFRCYNKSIDGKEIFFSNVAKVAPVAGKDEVAEVTFFTPFVAEKEYFISYNGVEVGSFTAIKVTKDSVVDIEVADGKVVAGEVTSIADNYKLLDASGIDIKDAVVEGKPLYTRATIKFTDADGSQAFTQEDDAGKRVFIKDADKTYTVELTYKDFKKTFKLTSVKQDKYEFAGFDYEKSGVYAVDSDDVSKAGAKAKKVTFTKGGNEVLQVVAIYKCPGKDDKYLNIVDAGFKAMSGDESICMVGDPVSGAAFKLELKGNNEGTANIIIYKTENNVQTAIGYIPVEVKGARKALTLDVELSNNKYNLALGTGYADSIKTKVVVKDQYEDIFGDQIYNIYSQDDASRAKVVAAIDGDGVITFVGSLGYGETVDVTLEFKRNDGLKKSVAIKVGNESIDELNGKPGSYKLSIDNKELDTALTEAADLTVKTATISTVGQTKNGFNYFGADTIANVTKNPASGERTTTGTSVSYKYTVSLNGSIINDGKTVENFVGDSLVAVVAGSTTNTSGSAVKLAAGTYTVTLWRVEDTYDINGKAITVASVADTANIVVKDSQKGLVVTKIAQRVTTGDERDAFTFKFDNAPVAVTVRSNYNQEKQGAYVVDATYVLNTVFGKFVLTTPIGTDIDLKDSVVPAV